uniref:Uncharacterized protein n=1 Tax=Magnetococcus massalia (strain MO-1) TaxID=451514 RepID=A0A1S7LLT6_MAGMO|nr:exported protein of unknown function [Candidatus Magnetococcus massalia]
MMRLLLTLLLLTLTLPAEAQSLAKKGEDAPELGRLFTTPRERQSLNFARLRKIMTSRKPKSNPVQQRSPDLWIDINGVIKREGGATAVWINGWSNLKENKLPKGVATVSEDINDPRLTISLSRGRGQVVIQPGQSVRGKGGRVMEFYEQHKVNLEEQRKIQAKEATKKQQQKAKLDRVEAGKLAPLPGGALMKQMSQTLNAVQGRTGGLQSIMGQGR